LCTGRDIITLWVSRMVMFNRYFTRDGETPGQLPFSDVYIHPIIQDGHGQRMSKSLGNGVDPLDLIESHGADAVRFVMGKLATATQDVRISVDLVCPETGKAFEPVYVTSPQGYKVAAPEQESPHAKGVRMVSAYGVAAGLATPSKDAPLARNTSSKFDEGRNFVTKLFNAARFTATMLGEATVRETETISRERLSLTDRWMLSRVAVTEERVRRALETYSFAEYANALYDLLWRDYCDWYLEAVKRTVKTNPVQQAVLLKSLSAILRLLHPLCPYVTEVIAEQLKTVRTGEVEGLSLEGDGLLVVSSWPCVDGGLQDPVSESAFEELRGLAEAIRQARAQHELPFREALTVHVPVGWGGKILEGAGLVEALANIASVEESPPSGDAIPFSLGAEAFALSGDAVKVDTGALRAQLEEAIVKLGKDIGALKGRLSNKGYVDRAPEKLVNETREQLASKEAELAEAQRRIGEL
jgi:valyl-tRNA synthetase